MIDRLHDIVARRISALGLEPSDLLERDFPGTLGRPGSVSLNGSCRLLKAADGWLALNLSRPDDLDVLPALVGEEGASWDAAERVAAASPAGHFRDRAAELQLPVAVLGETQPQPLAKFRRDHLPGKVVDLSALWAGPLCAGLLARAGATVFRVESLGRPDPTRVHSPVLDSRLNAGKIGMPLDLRLAEGRAALADLLAEADAVVTSARPAALMRLGISPDAFPHLTWVAITGHGFSGAESQRVGFGDDCAVAGGLVHWNNGQPTFLGDALADPLTGFEAAQAVLAGGRGLLDMAMARIAAAYARILYPC